MFVRVRHRNARLLLSVLSTSRAGGKVKTEHVAALPSCPLDPSVDDRIAFWQKLHQRMALLSNRIAADDQAKILGAVHARVPMPALDEQRGVQHRNAESEVDFWSRVASMNREQAAGHRDLAANYAHAAANFQRAADQADAKAAATKDRAERIARGEDEAGGLSKPMDWYRWLREEVGLSKKQIEHMMVLAQFSKEELNNILPEAIELGLRTKDRAMRKFFLDKLAEKWAREEGGEEGDPPAN
jgi:hypothetical protein